MAEVTRLNVTLKETSATVDLFRAELEVKTQEALQKPHAMHTEALGAPHGVDGSCLPRYHNHTQDPLSVAQ